MKPVDGLTPDAAGAVGDNGPLSLHRRAWDLIPWVVAGSADADEQDLVQTHARSCADCRAEIDFHEALKGGMVSAATPGPDEVEASWLRLRSRIADTDGVDSTGGAESSPVQVQVSDAARGPDVSRPVSNLARWLVAAVVVQSVGLTVLGAALVERAGSPAEYKTLSEPAAAEAVLPASAIRWVPLGTLTLAELQTLLDGLGWQVVQSSGDGALLVIAPRAGSQTGRDQALVRLREHPATQLAEPMPASR